MKDVPQNVGCIGGGCYKIYIYPRYIYTPHSNVRIIFRDEGTHHRHDDRTYPTIFLSLSVPFMHI